MGSENLLFGIVIAICTCIIDGTIIFLALKYFKYFETKNEINRIHYENEKIGLFMQTDIKATKDILDDYFKDQISKYTLENIIIKKIEFIKKPDIELMIKMLDRNIMLHIPEIYIYYIKLLWNVQDEHDLLVYIDMKVKEHVLDFVTSYNQQDPKDTTSIL